MAPKDYREAVVEEQRLAILQCLEPAVGYARHEYLLLEQVRALGLGVSHAAMRAELAWLSEAGLLTVDTVGEAQIARLTQHGVDAARGFASIPGVARPRP